MKLETVKMLFPEATEIRGKVWLAQMPVDRLLDGIPLNFTRRRYGGNVHRAGVTYTWVEAYINGQWVDLGDPWPVLNPPVAAMRQEIDRRKPQVVYA